jgi:glucose-6-phosphate 1-dehydrogenase
MTRAHAGEPRPSDARPFDMVVIGATGDLARRKLFPALYNLHQQGRLPAGRIFAAARQEGGRDGYLAATEEAARENMPAAEFFPEVWRSFSERVDYLQLDATDPASYAGLGEQMAGYRERARVFYLATPPNLYGDISQAIEDAGLITRETRIVLEKPIGHDLESAQTINNEVGRNFEENQIYRIDHYLGKETVQNLMALRFSNVLFEPLWSSEQIDHVQITVAETLGVEGRGGYYDKSGALRDMVQNHLLQLLCLTAMEPPARNDQDLIRGEKIKVLRSLRPISSLEDVARKTVRAQYRAGVISPHSVPGYLEEEGIDPHSTTETFVAIKAEIDNWRWSGVPFYLRTGKRLAHRVSEIVIQFRRVPHLLFADQGALMQENRLIIRLQPDESIKLGLMIKVPGSKMVLKRVFLNLNLADAYAGARAPLAYERLLMDVIRGNATLFMHRDEVEEAWKWCEPILDGWVERDDRVRAYGAGTWGPSESIALLERDGRSWYEQLA